MAKFPVESDDNTGVIDALNYLLSGPSGLGQYFAGFSSYILAYLTGNYRIPFSQSTPAKLYIAPITCSSAVQIDDRTFQYNFATTQPSPPFALGNQLTGAGWSNDFYNGAQGVIGAVKCTTDYVIFRTNNFYPGIGDDLTGGTVEMDLGGTLISTDCEARTTVTGGTDRVFVSGQLDQIPYYTVTSGTQDLLVTVQVNRYIGSLNNDPINPDYTFNLDETVASKEYAFTGLSGTGTLPLIETVFSSILDQPKPGLYRYILEVQFDGTSINVTQDDLYLRSLSAQVVKQ
jgi:hypothetical protein